MKFKKELINIAIILGFMIMAAAKIFLQEFSNLDEVWVYNFGRCIINGLLPYKDFNLIITPLFPYICAAFLKLFGDEMIVLRFAEMIETAAILFFVYKILDRVRINKGISLLFTLGLYYIFSDVFCFDYNWTVLLITLIVMFYELKDAKEGLKYNFKKDFILGILVRNNNFT